MPESQIVGKIVANRSHCDKALQCYAWAKGTPLHCDGPGVDEIWEAVQDE